MSRVLVTGATGFVGSYLCRLLASSGYSVVGTTRSGAPRACSEGYELELIGDLGSEINWAPLLHNVELVVHLAARVHIMHEAAADPLREFRRVNVVGTERLLRHAARLGVRRFIYLSSIKVHGEATSGMPFSALDNLSPLDPYSESKREAEQLVERMGMQLGIETVIIRPPLVYGPGVGGNFVRLLGMVNRGFPLPFGLVRNLRSLVHVQNLCDLIRECGSNSKACGNRFLVSDNNDVSTPDLIRLIASSMSRSPRLFPVPPGILEFAAGVLGKKAEVSRLVGSLQVDIDSTRRILGWEPPVDIEDGIASTVRWYRECRASG